MDLEMQERLGAAGVLAVVALESLDVAEPLAEALLAGGVTAMEMALRSPVAMKGLHKVCGSFPEMLIGAGTVLSPEQVREVKAAGADFAVSPGLNRRVVEEANKVGLPFGPGVCTPSEIEAAIELGCRILKYFPAETSGGLAHLRVMNVPFAHLGVRYIPLGGLSEENVGSYLADPAVIAVGGSWIAPAQAIRDRDWAGITQRARRAREIVEQLAGVAE